MKGPGAVRGRKSTWWSTPFGAARTVPSCNEQGYGHAWATERIGYLRCDGVYVASIAVVTRKSSDRKTIFRETNWSYLPAGHRLMACAARRVRPWRGSTAGCTIHGAIAFFYCGGAQATL